MTLLHKVTWTHKAAVNGKPIRLYRDDIQIKRTTTKTTKGNPWNHLPMWPSEDLTVEGAETMPVIEGYTDFSLQVYSHIPGTRQLDPSGKTIPAGQSVVVPGSRPLSFALRYFRIDKSEPDGENETAVTGPFVVSQAWLDNYWSFVHPTFLKTHPDQPVGAQIRYSGGPEYIDWENVIFKGWEIPSEK